MSVLSFPIRTARLLLRPFESGDLDAFHAMQRREDVARYLPWGPHTVEQSHEMLERIRAMTGIDEESDALRLAAVLPASAQLIGDFSIWRTSREHAQAEIGFVLHPDHHGRGYAHEGMAELMRIGFQVGRLHRIVGRCDARNAPSAAVMERLGMRREAHLRENEFLKGEWTDELVYAILDREWAAAAG